MENQNQSQNYVAASVSSWAFNSSEGSIFYFLPQIRQNLLFQRLQASCLTGNKLLIQKEKRNILGNREEEQEGVCQMRNSLAFQNDLQSNLNRLMLSYFSEGKHGLEIKYTPEDFLFRWKKLERIVEKESQDALLLVTGLDGAEHVYTNYLLNWLFLGLSGQAIFTNKYLDPIYSEMIIVISPQESFIFLTPQAKQEFEPLIYALQNCNVYCPTEKEYAAKDSLDILKISFFYQSVAKLKKIGLFLGPEQDSKIIEKWPIIQSYALQPVGRTFFTLKYETVNLSQRLLPLFKNLDKHSLKNLVATTADSLQGQIRGSTQVIEYTSQAQRGNISQLKLQQPLFEAADIAKIEVQGGSVESSRVLFGSRTATKENSSVSTIQSAQAYHFTVEHTDPITKLQVWRTYFLNLCTKSIGSVSLVHEQSEESFLVTSKYAINHRQNPDFWDRSWLIASYLGLVQGVIDGIATISKDYRNLNIEFLLAHILSKVGQLNFPKGHAYSQKDLEVFLESYDAQGQPKPIDFKDSITFKLTTNFYVLKVRLNNIKSVETGKALGSVCFSESFLLQEGCFLLLTKETPYFDFWKTDKEQYSLLQNLNPNVAFPQLGACLSPEFRYRLFVPIEKLSSIHFNIPLLQVKYYFHENGLRIYSEKAGWHVLLYQDIENASMINKISGQWVLFKTKSALLFEGVENNYIVMEFRGKAFDCLLKKVNDKEKPLSLSFMDVIPPLLAENWYFNRQILNKDAREGAMLYQHQILQNDFLFSFIEAKQLMVLNQMKDIKLTAFKSLYQQKIDKKIQPAVQLQKPSLAVITGTYATSKFKLAQTLARFGNKNVSYHVFHVPYENLFSRMEIATYVEMLDQFIKETKEAPKRLFIVVLPCWLNAAETIAVLNDRYDVRNVIAAISVGGFYTSKNGGLADNVLTFAVPGFAQAVVLDSRGQSEQEISAISKILWAFNREAKITRSSNSTLSTGQVSDLLGESLYNSEYHRFLRSKYGFLYKFDSLSKLQIGYIEFKYPIYDLPSLKSLSMLEGCLVDLKALKEDLLPKKEEAEQSKDELMETLFRLEEAIALQRRKQKCPKIRCIKGAIKTQEGETLQIVWAGQQMKQRHLSDNHNLGLFIMASNYDEFQVKQFLLKLTYRKFIFQGIKSLRELQSITEEERLAISKEGRDRYLDGGQFFDGYFYRDVQGHILKEHPQLDKLIDEWLEQTNKQIESHNKQIRQQWQVYRKQYE